MAGTATARKAAPQYQVMLDHQGVRYLLVGGKMGGVLLVLNTGKSVDLVEMDNATVKTRDLRPVANASILDAAKELYKPLNSSVQVSPRAKSVLETILNDKEIQAMARVAVAAKAAPAEATAPTTSSRKAKPVLVKGSKKAATPAKAAKAAASNGDGRPRYANHKIQVVNREHGAREGTKRAQAMEILFKSKTTDDALPKLVAIGADNSFIRYAVTNGLIKLSE